MLYVASALAACALAIWIVAGAEPLAVPFLLFSLLVIDFTRKQTGGVDALRRFFTSSKVFVDNEGQYSFFEPLAPVSQSADSSKASGPASTPSVPTMPAPVFQSQLCFDAYAPTPKRPTPLTSDWLWSGASERDFETVRLVCFDLVKTTPGSARAVEAAFRVMSILRTIEFQDFNSKEAIYEHVAARAGRCVDAVKKIALGTYPPIKMRLAQIDPKTLKLT